jgi:hypothetical protein
MNNISVYRTARRIKNICLIASSYFFISAVQSCFTSPESRENREYSGLLSWCFIFSSFTFFLFMKAEVSIYNGLNRDEKRTLELERFTFTRRQNLQVNQIQ